MKKLFNRNKNVKTNDSIDKSLKIIKKEKEKIREEKRKIKYEKEKKFYSTKFGIFLKDFFDVNENEKEISKTIKRRISYNIINIMFGFFLCLTILFVLSGGKNYLKLYYELEDFIDTYDTISNDYYGDVDNKNIVDSAIDSLINSVGDSYTTYTNEEETEIFLEDLVGTYEGIGCMVSMDEESNIYVVEVFDGTPADKAGIKVNDIILEIDGIDYTDKTSEDMASYVKKQAKKEINIKIKRSDEELSIVIVRKKVQIPTVSSEIIEEDNKKIGYIKIDIFSSVTNEQFEKKLKALEKKDISGLIVDVRDNTGGYLNVVTDISSLFLEEGKVIYQLETEDKKEKVKDKTSVSRKYPVVVLVNGFSASASEIFAASIKESYTDGYVVGVSTFGKGTVQKTKKLKNGNMIKYTVQKWLTPKGKYISDNGVSPTHLIEFEDNGEAYDSQLDYSIKLLLEKLNKK